MRARIGQVIRNEGDGEGNAAYRGGMGCHHQSPGGGMGALGIDIEGNASGQWS